MAVKLPTCMKFAFFILCEESLPVPCCSALTVLGFTHSSGAVPIPSEQKSRNQFFTPKRMARRK